MTRATVTRNSVDRAWHCFAACAFSVLAGVCKHLLHVSTVGTYVL